MTEIKVGDVVTVSFESMVSSNTYHVDTLYGVDLALLTHPLYSKILLSVPLEELNKVQPNVKDSIERSLDFAKINMKYLDYNISGDLDALCMYFVVKRKLTPRQKNTLANICGVIASIKLNNNIEQAMAFIKTNNALLDDFNKMWYNNFNGLFNGTQPITSKKQRSAIFNIAGFLMAELGNPTTAK